MQELLSSLTDDGARQLASALFFEAQSRCGDDDLATASQIGSAAEVLLELDRKSRLKPQTSLAASLDDSDDPTAGLRDFIQKRRQDELRPDAIFLGARSSERK